MTAYAIGLLESVNVGHEILQYIEEVEGTFEPFGGYWLVHGADPEVREGDYDGDVVIIGFPSLLDARAWYESSDYQRIAKLRHENASSVILFVDGVPDGYRAQQTADKLAELVSNTSG